MHNAGTNRPDGVVASRICDTRGVPILSDVTMDLLHEKI